MIMKKRVDTNYLITNFYFIIFVFLIAIICCVFTLNFINPLGYYKWLSFSIQNKIWIERHYKYIAIEIFYLILFCYLVFCYFKSEKRKINKKLAKFIINNNLIVYEQKQNTRIIKDKAEIYFILKERNLKIEIKLNGSIFDDKLKNSREKLEDIFECSAINIDEGFGFIAFNFVLEPQERLKAMNYMSNVVPLDLKRFWDYDQAPHALIAGVTGSGKTYFVNYLICNLLYHKAELFFVDPKSADIKALGEFIDVEKVATKENQIAKIVREFREEMERRQKLLSERKKTNLTYRKLKLNPEFLIFDEFAAFKSVADKKIAKEIEDNLTSIILMGRSTGNFVILITQQPNAEVINTGIREQLNLKVGFGNLKEETRRMLFGTGVNLHKIDSSVKGVGYISIGNGEPFKYYAPNLGSEFDFEDEIVKLI